MNRGLRNPLWALYRGLDQRLKEFKAAQTWAARDASLDRASLALQALSIAVSLAWYTQELAAHPELHDAEAWQRFKFGARYTLQLEAGRTLLPSFLEIRQHVARLSQDERAARSAVSGDLVEALKQLIAQKSPRNSNWLEGFVRWFLHQANAKKGVPIPDKEDDTDTQILHQARSGSFDPDRLSRLHPPLAWDEVLLHYWEQLDGESLEVKRAWRTVLGHDFRRPCTLCGQEFEVRPNNPYQTRHPGCSTRLRQQRRRERLQGMVRPPAPLTSSALRVYPLATPNGGLAGRR